MVSNESQVLCGHHCGQLSAELKRDRSTVRISEVQSTLIEHRYVVLNLSLCSTFMLSTTILLGSLFWPWEIMKLDSLCGDVLLFPELSS